MVCWEVLRVSAAMFWLNASITSSGYHQDWGLYAIVPVLQPKGLKKVGETLKANPATRLAKPPGLSTKEGKQKEFHGFNGSFGAAFLMGVTGEVKLGFQK